MQLQAPCIFFHGQLDFVYESQKASVKFRACSPFSYKTGLRTGPKHLSNQITNNYNDLKTQSVKSFQHSRFSKKSKPLFYSHIFWQLLCLFISSIVNMGFDQEAFQQATKRF